MKHNGDLFECYSPRLRGWFMAKGIRYERTFIHSKTGKRCWVYRMDTRLAIALMAWKDNNPNKNSEEVA